MVGRPINAAPPVQADNHPQADVGLDDLPIPDLSAPDFPVLTLPAESDEGFVNMSEATLPDLPDFFEIA